MATVTTKTGAVTFVLELDEAEAQYVEAALRTSTCNNSPDGGDPTWDALLEAMRANGVATDPSAAS